MNLTAQAHACILHCMQNPTYSLDATCGSGYDTIFLQSITQKKVWSVDVQIEALHYAQTQVTQQEPGCPVQWVHKGHQFIDQFVDKALDVVMFNFGYWPKGNHEVTTLPQHSLTAVQKALTMLSPSGVMTLLLYPGHPQGKIEATQIQSWIHALPTAKWKSEVFLSQRPTDDTPILWVIQPKN